MATENAIVIRRFVNSIILLESGPLALVNGQFGFAREEQTLVCRDTTGEFFYIKTESAMLEEILVKEPVAQVAALPSSDQTGTLRMVLEADSYYFKTASTWVRIPDIGYFEQMLNNLLERIDTKQDLLAAGDHQITLGDGSATPPTSNFRFGTGTAEGATPEANFEMYDSATFKATDNARLELYGGAKQMLADSSQLSMSQSSQLHMSSDANLLMHQNAKAFLTDNAQLLMHNSSILKTLHNTKTEIRGNLNDEYSSLPALPSADFYHIWICSSSNGPRTQGLIWGYGCSSIYALHISRNSENENWSAAHGTWRKIIKDNELAAHTDNASNPHGVTKSQIGLGNVSNTDMTNMGNAASGTLAVARGGTGRSDLNTATTTQNGITLRTQRIGNLMFWDISISGNTANGATCTAPDIGTSRTLNIAFSKTYMGAYNISVAVLTWNNAMLTLNYVADRAGSAQTTISMNSAAGSGVLLL